MTYDVGSLERKNEVTNFARYKRGDMACRTTYICYLYINYLIAFRFNIINSLFSLHILKTRASATL